MNSIVNTPRLTIRKIEIEDGDRDLISRLAEKSPEFGFFSNFRGGDKLDLLYQFFWDEAIRSDQYNCLIFLKDNGEFIGHINMQKIDSALPELGIELLDAYQNQGYGPEAIIAFCNWYSKTYELQKVKAKISDENTHSIHVVEKLGASYVAFTPFFSPKILDTLKEKLPGADLSEFTQNSIREYILRLPIFCDD